MRNWWKLHPTFYWAPINTNHWKIINHRTKATRHGSHVEYSPTSASDCKVHREILGVYLQCAGEIRKGFNCPVHITFYTICTAYGNRMDMEFPFRTKNTGHEGDQYGSIQMLCWFSQPQGCIIQWINLIGWMNLHHATDPWPSILVCSLLACLSVSDVVDTLYTVQVAGQQVNLIPCNYGEGRSGCNLSYRRRPPAILCVALPLSDPAIRD